MKPDSKSTSSSASVLPSTTFCRTTWNFPSGPSAGGDPLVYAKVPSVTPRAMPFRRTFDDSRRGGAMSRKKDYSTSDALMPSNGDSPGATGSPSFTRSAILRGVTLPWTRGVPTLVSSSMIRS